MLELRRLAKKIDLNMQPDNISILVYVNLLDIKQSLSSEPSINQVLLFPISNITFKQSKLI